MNLTPSINQFPSTMLTNKSIKANNMLNKNYYSGSTNIDYNTDNINGSNENISPKNI